MDGEEKMNINEIKEKLMPSIRQVIPLEDEGKIPSLFEKIYLLDYNQEYDAYVLAYWNEDMPALAFNVDDGEFLGVVMKQYVQTHGELIWTEDPSSQ